MTMLRQSSDRGVPHTLPVSKPGIRKHKVTQLQLFIGSRMTLSPRFDHATTVTGIAILKERLGLVALHLLHIKN